MFPVFNVNVPITLEVEVFDEFKNPNPGVNIAVNGKIITETDFNGRFTVPFVSKDSIITISYVGMKTVESTAESLPKKIFLERDTEELKDARVLNDYKAPNYWLLGAGIVGLGLLGFLAYKKAKTTNYKRAKL